MTSDHDLVIVRSVLIAATGRPIALFLHKPLFLEDLNEGPASAACIVPLARASLVDRLHKHGVSLVVSGHLHQYRDRTFNGARHLWQPAVAFAAPQSHGGDARCGLTLLDFSHDGVEITIERPEGMVSHDLAAIKGHGRYRFLRDFSKIAPLPANAPVRRWQSRQWHRVTMRGLPDMFARSDPQWHWASLIEEPIARGRSTGLARRKPAGPSRRRANCGGVLRRSGRSARGSAARACSGPRTAHALPAHNLSANDDLAAGCEGRAVAL